MPQNCTNEKSTLDQATSQTTSHYLSQCWSSSLSPWGIPRPHWVNPLRPPHDDICDSKMPSDISLAYSSLQQTNAFLTGSIPAQLYWAVCLVGGSEMVRWWLIFSCDHAALWMVQSVRLQLNPRKQGVSLQLMTSCCMNFAIIIQWVYFTIWEKIKKNRHHYNTILSFYNIKILQEEFAKKSNIPWIWRIILWTQITLYEEEKKEEASMRCSLLHGSWDQILQRRPSVCHTFLTIFPSSYHHEIFRSYYQWQKWRPCKRTRSEVEGQGHRGQHPT